MGWQGELRFFDLRRHGAWMILRWYTMAIGDNQESPLACNSTICQHVKWHSFLLFQIKIICESLVKRSSRSLRENGTPRTCRPGGWCRDCYPGAPTVGRATAAHLGFGCPKFHLRAPDPRLGRVVSGPRCQHHDGRPGRWFRDWLLDDMPHFHSITFHNDWAVVYMRHNVDSCIHVVSLYIDNKHIEFEFEFELAVFGVMDWTLASFVLAHFLET